MHKNAVVIVAAGRGERLGAEAGPKQYRLMSGMSVLQHTVNCFLAHPEIHAIQVVIHKDDRKLYDDALKPHVKLRKPVFGGETRQASCKAGIDALEEAEFDKVMIHDAARPFVSSELIDSVLAGTAHGTCALPAIAVADTLKRANTSAYVTETLDRKSLHLAQTPQGFLLAEIKAAHASAVMETEREFTDDAAVAEWADMQVMLVKGDRDNFKITTKQDFDAAIERMKMRSHTPDIRTGNGYDVHTLGPGDSIILCGVEIPHHQKLQGHSDADVGLHALTDALLGTIGAGDIGSHFPPTDERWKDAASDQFLAHAMKLVTDHGGKVTNLDVTLVCETPKIGPHRDAMRQKLAEICGLSLERVSVKATTNEKIGFIGRQEGIAALATATVSFGMMQNV